MMVCSYCGLYFYTEVLHFGFITGGSFSKVALPSTSDLIDGMIYRGGFFFLVLLVVTMTIVLFLCFLSS